MTCYLCGKEETFRTVPVVESPKDVECPPKANICRDCYNRLEEE